MILRICCQESHSCWRGVWWLVKYLVWNLLSFRPYLFRSWIQFVSAKTRRVGTESGHTLPPRKQQTSNNRVSQHESTGRLICWPIESKPHWLSLAIQQKRKRGVARRDWPARPSPLQSQAENDRVISFHFISVMTRNPTETTSWRHGALHQGQCKHFDDCIFKKFSKYT